MAKLSIFDIVELAKAGYKAADIEKLTSVDIPEDVEPDKPAEDETPAPEELPTAENASKENAQDRSGSGTSNDNIDYKKLYEDKCAELEAAQKNNTHQNQSKPKDNAKTIDEIVRSFM